MHEVRKMESYVEVSWLNGVLLLYLSALFASYAMFQPLKDLHLLFYAAIISMLSVSLWQDGSLFIVILVELLFFLTLFRYARKTYIVAFCFRVLCMLTSYVIYQGSFHNGFWFVPIQASIIPCWLLYLLFLFFCKSRWRIRFSEKNCLYPLTLYVGNKHFKVIGYLDSGNLLSHEGIPVVFLQRRYLSYFVDERIQLVVMKTVQEESSLPCYTCELKLHGCHKRKVLVHLQEDLKLPMHSELLLNMKVMTMG